MAYLSLIRFEPRKVRVLQGCSFAYWPASCSGETRGRQCDKRPAGEFLREFLMALCNLSHCLPKTRRGKLSGEVTVMSKDQMLRSQLIALLRKSEAHAGFDRAVKGIPEDKMGVRPKGSPHSAWELLEHIRLAQRDILEFSQSAAYAPRKWPDDYWPGSPSSGPCVGMEEVRARHPQRPRDFHRFSRRTPSAICTSLSNGAMDKICCARRC